MSSRAYYTKHIWAEIVGLIWGQRVRPWCRQRCGIGCPTVSLHYTCGLSCKKWQTIFSRTTHQFISPRFLSKDGLGRILPRLNLPKSKRIDLFVTFLTLRVFSNSEIYCMFAFIEEMLLSCISDVQ